MSQLRLGRELRAQNMEVSEKLVLVILLREIYEEKKMEKVIAIHGSITSYQISHKMIGHRLHWWSNSAS